MRTRTHPGILNRYMARTNLDSDAAAYTGTGLTQAMAVTWLWRARQWVWEGELDWNTSSPSSVGEGSFGGALAVESSPYAYGGFGDERDLMSREYIVHEANANLGVGEDITIGLSMFITTTRTRNSQPSPPYATQQFFPQVQISLSGPFGLIVTDNLSPFLEHGNGEDHANRYMRVDYPMSGGDYVAGYIKATPYEYWAYADAGGSNPIWDTATGARLLDPHGLI